MLTTWLAIIGTAFLWFGASQQAEDALVRAAVQGKDDSDTSVIRQSCVALIAGAVLAFRVPFRSPAGSLARRLAGWSTIFFGAFLAFLAALATVRLGWISVLVAAFALIVPMASFGIVGRKQVSEVLGAAMNPS